MRHESTAGGFFLGVSVSMLVFAIIANILGNPATQLRQEAIEAGAAEYYIDENHEKQFRWITEEPAND